MYETGAAQAVGGEDDVRTPLGPTASGPAPDTAALRTFRESLAGTLDGLDDAARIDQIRALEELKAAAAAAQARLSADFDASQSEAQAARRDAPRNGGRYLGLATALIRLLPHTMRGLRLGQVSEWRAMLILREIACLSDEDQREVDRRRAVNERHVSVLPAPDTMSYLSALLPMSRGVAVSATLQRHQSRSRYGWYHRPDPARRRHRGGIPTRLRRYPRGVRPRPGPRRDPRIYTKETPGWNAKHLPGPRHSVCTTTPTGHAYQSRAPRLPGAPPETTLTDYSYIEGVLVDLHEAA